MRSGIVDADGHDNADWRQHGVRSRNRKSGAIGHSQLDGRGLHERWHLEQFQRPGRVQP